MSFIGDVLRVSNQGKLTIGGAEVSALAREYGTPVYLMDESAVIQSCGEFTSSLKAFYPGEAAAAYASKALSFTYLYRLVKDCGLHADIVSGGELYCALRAGMDAKHLIFHGNCKTRDELSYALDNGVGSIVLDNREELDTLNALCEQKNTRASVAFRLKPGIEAHTHELIQTGKLDSKFGFALEKSDALDAVLAALNMKRLDAAGVHCHIGSQIFDAEPFALAVEVMMTFMKRVQTLTGHTFRDLNLGGGYGIRYLPSDDPRPIPQVVRAAADAVKRHAEELNYPLPRLILEPGRSITGPAGVTAYTIGSVKRVEGVRTYVAVDGGMGDNPRPALYGAAYHAVLADRPLDKAAQTVTLSGRYCETDRLIADLPLPDVKAGEILAVLGTGAYNYSMASNYNRVPRPPVVMVKEGKPVLAVRRETYEDLVKCDL